MTKMNDHIPAKLFEIAKDVGLHIEHRATVYRRGWPQPSAKPYGLYYSDGSHLSSFSTLKSLENNLRARAGC